MKQVVQRSRRYWLFIIALLIVNGCAITPPQDTRNICNIFREHPDWYLASKHVEKRWGLPVHVQMAIMRQESSFDSDARPPREMLLGFIPGDHISSAYGYAQALDGTWLEYQRETRNFDSDRDNFRDATDFMGWYARKAYQKAGIRPQDTYRLYLAYHEGVAGYLKKSYRAKKWLVEVAKRVERTAHQYQLQLSRCVPLIEKSARWNNWF